MGNEFYIYEGSPENPTNIYKGHTIEFIEDLMKYFNIRDDN